MSTADKQVHEKQASGVSLVAKLKRGTETRDQDELKIKGKGSTAAEAIENFEESLQAAEEHGWMDRLRELQAGDTDE